MARKNLGAIVFGAVVLLLAVGLLQSCGGPKAETVKVDAQKLADDAGRALGASDAVKSVTATEDGEVEVTLSVSKFAMESAGIDKYDAGEAFAGTILSQVPEARKVTVYDSHGSAIDFYSRTN